MAPEWTDEAERDIPFAVILELMGGSLPNEIWTQVESHLKSWGHDVGSSEEIRKHWVEVTWERIFLEPKIMKVEAAAADPAAPKLPVPDWYHDAVLL
ncbi:Glycosylphosphatidylinositol (GPI) anchor assembly protein [Pestalotiopsis sp. IQ-011]